MLTCKPSKKKTITTTLNDIPAGTVFEGTVTSASGRSYTGVFLRLYTGTYADGKKSNVYAVGLTVADDRSSALRGVPIQFLGCRTVTNYRKLENPAITELEC